MRSYKKARVIYNPKAGYEMIQDNLADILITLENAGYETSAHATKSSGDAIKEAERVSKAGFDLVVAAGGDGTINEVVTGIASYEFRPKLAVLPFGTSNDFARANGITSISEGLKVIQEGKTKLTDVGKMNDKYFIHIAGGGAFTELAYEVPSKMKAIIGQLAYYIKGIEKIPNLKPNLIQFDVNGTKFEKEVMIFLVANSNMVGVFDKLAPRGKFDDGKFDVFYVEKCNLVEMSKILGMLIRGEHFNHPKVAYFQTNHIKVTSDEDILINLDGELGGKAPAEFSILEKHIEVFVK